MKNLFALIILAAQKALLTEKIPEVELAEQRLLIARTLIESKRYDTEKIRRFLYFLKTFIHIENPEINGIFDRQIESLTGNKNFMGIIETITMLTMEEGIEKGMIEGIEKGEQNKTYEIVKNLLLNTDFDIAKIAALANTPESFVRNMQKDIK